MEQESKETLEHLYKFAGSEKTKLEQALNPKNWLKHLIEHKNKAYDNSPEFPFVKEVDPKCTPRVFQLFIYCNFYNRSNTGTALTMEVAIGWKKVKPTLAHLTNHLAAIGFKTSKRKTNFSLVHRTTNLEL